MQNGVTTAICTSLKNNTGYSTSNGNNDCTDIDNANDCLVGNMASELTAYDVCDWKTFMKRFIPNVYNVIKSIICAMCGIWTKLETLECEIKYLYNGASFSFGEQTTSGSSGIVAGKGVSYKVRSSSTPLSSDLSVTYVAGGLGRIGGSLSLYQADFTDVDATLNFDQGSTTTDTASRLGNSVWGTTGAMVDGGELLYEVRLKKSEYPQIKSIFSGMGQETGGGGYHIRATAYAAGSYAPGQHGTCNTDGTPYRTGMDSGHLVPDGWIYIQVRMTYIDALVFADHSDGRPASAWYSPLAWLGMRMNRDEIDC